MGHRFNPAHVDRLESPERRRMLSAEAWLERLGIDAQSVVVDVGCGPGYFAIPAARMNATRVYGVDVSDEMLGYLRNRCQEASVETVEGVHATAEHIPLSDSVATHIICSMVLHEVDDLDRVLREFHRLLQHQGKALIIDWEKRVTELGPPVHHRLDKQLLLEKLTAHGFVWECNQPNVQQYVVIAQKCCKIEDEKIKTACD